MNPPPARRAAPLPGASEQAPAPEPAVPSASFLIGPRPGQGNLSQFEFTLAVTAALSALYGGIRID